MSEIELYAQEDRINRLEAENEKLRAELKAMALDRNAHLARAERALHEGRAVMDAKERRASEDDFTHYFNATARLTRENAELYAENERLRAALRDLVDRWSTERGYDGAIRRARALLAAAIRTGT